MKETTFIEQNKKKWEKFEKLHGQKNNDPDEMSNLFIEITEDLSFAKTFYPKRSVRIYLNQLAQNVFTNLYKQKKHTSQSSKFFESFIKFWKETVPIEIYRSKHNLISAALFFLLAVFIGAISQHYDPDFVRIILGDKYVNETEVRILEGDPMGIYGEAGQVDMFFAITINNIRVAFIAFAMGILASFGTYILLLSNGIMLGAFQWWFKAKGLLLTSFLAVWIHGAFEISAIVIAGGAGITLGNGLLFPKSYSRLQSMIFSAKRGLVILLSLVPIFIVAGFLESFVTRYYGVLPDIVKWLIILTSFAIIILYYVIYPIIVANRHPDKLELKEIPRYIPERNIDYEKIRNSGEIFADSFYIFLSKFGKISNLFFKIPLVLALILGAGLVYNYYFDFNFIVEWHKNFEIVFGNKPRYFQLYKMLSWPLIISFLIAISYFIAENKIENKSIGQFFKFFISRFIWIFVYAFLLYNLFVYVHWFFLIIILIFLGPMLMMCSSKIMIEKQNFFTAFSNSFQFSKGTYSEGIGNMAIFTSLTIIFFFVLHNPMDLGVLTLIDNTLKDMLVVNVKDYNVIINIFNFVIYYIFIGYMFILTFISFALYHYSEKEKSTAKGLFEKLEKFGKRNRNFETDIDFE